MSESLDISSRPPETSLAPPPPGAVDALEQALAASPGERPGALAVVARVHPWWPDVWAALGESASGVERAKVAGDAGDEAEGAHGDVESYAYFRVGYHRGLDALRKAGWRGSGYVRWAVPENRGFLRCLEGLRSRAQAIGEEDEAERCAAFLRQLDPSWPPASMR